MTKWKRGGMTLTDILQQVPGARLTAGNYWLVWETADEYWEIYSQKNGNVIFESAFRVEENAVDKFLGFVGTEGESANG